MNDTNHGFIHTHSHVAKDKLCEQNYNPRATHIYAFFFFSWNQVFVNTMSPASARLARVRACVNAQLHRQRSRKKKTRVPIARLRCGGQSFVSDGGGVGQVSFHYSILVFFLLFSALSSIWNLALPVPSFLSKARIHASLVRTSCLSHSRAGFSNSKNSRNSGGLSVKGASILLACEITYPRQRKDVCK